MPIFEYKCEECNIKFEEFRSLSNTDPVQCPQCNSNKTSKLFSAQYGCYIPDNKRIKL